MAGEKYVLYAIDAGVATITLNRPEKLNALTFAMRDELVGLIERAGADDSVRVIVVKGNGRAFCSGVDLDDHPELQDPTGKTFEADRAEIARAAECWLRLWTVSKPIIVKAHGYCVAWGLELALHADFVLAADDCQFFFPSVRNGAGLPDSAIVVYHVGLQWARRLLYTGDAVDGRTAARIGLALDSHPVAELDSAVAALATRIGVLPNELVAQSKAVVNEAVELMGREELQHFATDANATARQSESVAEFSRIVREQGRHAAIQWRDDRPR